MKENFINYLPLKIYRYLRWKKSINREYRFIRDNFSEEYAQLCLEAVKASRQNRSTEDVLSAYAKKDAYISSNASKALMEWLKHIDGERNESA